MMKHDIANVGMGACGGNMTDEFCKNGYDGLVINASPDDLRANDCPNQFHISGEYGCSKNRNKGLEIAGRKYDQIGDVIYNTFFRKKVINFHTSAGGGWGSGSTPLVIEYMKAKYPDKIYNVMGVLPSDNEGKKVRKNAIAFFEDLKKIEGVSGIYLIDNNSHQDRFYINKRFVELYDKYINISYPDKRGVVDPDEVETMSKAKGCVYIATISDTKHFTNDKKSPFYYDNNLITNLGVSLNRQLENNIFVPPIVGCEYLTISKAHDDVKEGCLRKILGEPSVDEFHGYNNSDEHLIIATGMPFPHQRIAQLIESVNKDEERQDRVERQKEEIEMPTLKTKKHIKPLSTNQSCTNNHKKVDIQAMMNKFR